jgi:hypothetical protein
VSQHRLNVPAAGIFRALLFLSFLTTPVFADEAVSQETSEDEQETENRRATTDRSLLVWGPSSSRDDGIQAAQALEERLDVTEPIPARVLRISDWLGAARFRIGGSGQLVACEALEPELPEGVERSEELGSLIKRGRAALDELDSETALTLFHLAEKRVPCQQTFLDKETFHAIFFYGGIAAFFSGDSDEASRMFRQSATIDPSHDWSASYGPEPQSTFLSAVQDVIARPQVRVYGDMRGTNYLEVRVDGSQLDRTKAFETTVQPGLHLIQAVEEDGSWSTFLRQLDEGGSLTFFSALGAERLVLEGPESVLVSFSGTVLAKRAKEERLDEIYVVTVDPSGENEPQVFSWITATQEWIRIRKRVEPDAPTGVASVSDTTPQKPEKTLTPAEKRRAALLRDPSYRTSTTFGFKYTSLFLCQEDTASSGDCADGRQRKNDYMGGAVGVDIRLIKGLNIDLRFGASFSDPQEGGTILPEIGAGIRYRFLTGSVQPFLGTQALLLIGTDRPQPNASDKVALYGGIIGYGGVDFEFDDGFRISFEGGGGAILGGENGAREWPIVHGQFALGRFLP